MQKLRVYYIATLSTSVGHFDLLEDKGLGMSRVVYLGMRDLQDARFSVLQPEQSQDNWDGWSSYLTSIMKSGCSSIV